MAIIATSSQQHNPVHQQRQRRGRNYRHHHRPKRYSTNSIYDNDRNDCTQRLYATKAACCCLMVSLLLLLPLSTTTEHTTTTFPFFVLASSTGGSSSGTNSLPRSRSRHHPPVSSTTLHQYHDNSQQHQQQQHEQQPDDASSSSSSILTNIRQQQQQLWNPSPLIDPISGLLKYVYQRIPGEWEMEMKLRRTKNTIIESSSSTASVSSSSSAAALSNTKTKGKPTTIINNSYCQIRQVPGDGNCLFHSISFGLNYVTNRTHYDLSTTTDTMPHDQDDIENRGEEYSLSGKASTGLRTRRASKQQPTLHDLYIQSQSLRDQCVQYIRKYMTSYYGYGSKKLYLQGSEYINCKELIDAAAQQYNITAIEYCNSMAEDSVWGGGPEIVVLCNLLQRPIHVYELTTTTTALSSSSMLFSENGNQNKGQHVEDHFGNDNMKFHPSTQQQQHQPAFVLRRMACFGSPKFDYRDAIHILSADSRFPDLRPGQQLRAGNHFLAVFPIQRKQQENDDDDDDDDPNHQRHRRKRIRRGGDSSITGRLPTDENKMNHRNDNNDLTIRKKLLTPFNNLLYTIIMQYIHWWNDIIQRFI